MRINPDKVRRDNEERAKKENVTIKSGLIINSGENPTKESRKQLFEENKIKYELTQEQVDELVSDDELFVIKRKKRIKFTNFVESYVKENGNDSKMIIEEEKETKLENFEDFTEKEIDQLIKSTKKNIKELETYFINF
jgi:hypothetical protein